MRKKIKLIITCAVFYILVIGCGKIFRYILIDDTSSYTRIMFHEMYEQECIDVLFVGSSHCYRTINPQIMDEELGANTFNAGTSSQKLDGSYMIIREAARYNKIEHVYLELYFNEAFCSYKSRTQLTDTYIISDYLKPSLDKIRYILEASSKEHYINSFVPARRVWLKFFDEQYVKELIIKKESKDYKNYKYTYVTGDSEWYVGKGYVANDIMVKDWDFFLEGKHDNIDFSNVTGDWIDTLKDIIAFCNKKDISLTLFSAPMSNYLLVGLGNYDEYIAIVQSIIADTNVEYYDFNLCKEIFFPNKSELFKDDNHLNCYGAEIFSYLLADFINGNISENELFYDSYEEKIRNLKPTVFGISYQDSDNDNQGKKRNCKIVSTGKDNLEYEVILYPKDEEAYKVQKFSDNEFFPIESDKHGVITIIYRLKYSPEDKQTVTISY